MNTFLDRLSGTFDQLWGKIDTWFDQIILFLPNIFLAIIVGGISFFIAKYVRKTAVKSISKFTRNKTMLSLTSNLVSILFSIFVLFIILSILNLDGTINKILATAGVLGLAVGLALQDPMNNLFSGIFMSVRELYNIGDLVETNSYFGYITKIDLRSTKLELPTGEEVVIPNKQVIQSPLKNFSSSGKRRIDLHCGVSYQDDLSKVEDLAIKTISQMEIIWADKPVELIFTDFGESSINFTLRFWLKAPSQKECLKAKSEGIQMLKKAFDQSGINIPYPIRTLEIAKDQSLKVNALSNGYKQNPND
jgi:small conductance mechanosensitive channel